MVLKVMQVMGICIELMEVSTFGIQLLLSIPRIMDMLLLHGFKNTQDLFVAWSSIQILEICWPLELRMGSFVSRILQIL